MSRWSLPVSCVLLFCLAQSSAGQQRGATAGADSVTGRVNAPDTLGQSALMRALQRLDSLFTTTRQLNARIRSGSSHCTPNAPMPVARYEPGEAERQRDEGLWRVDPKAVLWITPCQFATQADSGPRLDARR